jgi:hypothetical protein
MLLAPPGSAEALFLQFKRMPSDVISACSAASAAGCHSLMQWAHDRGAALGPIVTRGPLFKSKPNRPLEAQADVTQADDQSTVTYAEVMLGARGAAKLRVTVRQRKHSASAGAAVAASGELSTAEQSIREAEAVRAKHAGESDVEVTIQEEWLQPLSTIVSVAPIPLSWAVSVDDSAAKSDDAAAAFAVVYLAPSKDPKPTPVPADPRHRLLHRVLRLGAFADAGDAASAVAHGASEYESASVACAQRLARPSLRARAYIVPGELGGAAARDEWVLLYRAAVTNFWHERLECAVIPDPEIFQWCAWCSYVADQRAPVGTAVKDTNPRPLALVVLGTHRVYVLGTARVGTGGAVPKLLTGFEIAHMMQSVELSELSPISTTLQSITQLTVPAAGDFTAMRLQAQGRHFATLDFWSSERGAEFIAELERTRISLSGDGSQPPIPLSFDS